MTIRPAVTADIPDLVAMVERLTATSAFQQGTVFDAPTVTAVITGLVEMPHGGLFVAQGAGGDLVGMIGVVSSPHPISGEAIVTQVCWWVDPPSRGRVGWLLLRAAETWAHTRGASALQMVAPNAHFAKGFSRHGYVEAGTVFERRL